MKRFGLTHLSLNLLLFFGAFGVAQVGDGALHFVVEVAGEASYSREGWARDVPLYFGAVLQEGDLIRLSGDARVVIVCADLSLKVLKNESLTPVDCPERSPFTSYRGKTIGSGRGEPAGRIPRVLAPRASHLLTDRPSFRWQRVEETETYQVALIREPGEVVWALEVSGTELAYPSPYPLLPGELYRLEVMTRVSDRVLSSTADSERGLGFGLLGSDEAEAVRLKAQQLAALEISPEAQRFLSANLYATNKLYSEAISLLGGWDTAPDEVAVQRLLGELFISAKLYDRAEGHLQRALELAQTGGHLYEQARVQERLGDIDRRVRGNFEEAAEHYEQSLTLYQHLEDAAGEERLLKGLSDL